MERPGEVVQSGEARSSRIEALRAIAALAVVAWHAAVITYPTAPVPEAVRKLTYAGGLGVFLFFTLTGYLLFRPFVRLAFESGKRISLGTYARNRALRILPLYFAVVVVLLVVQEGGGTAAQWWRFLTFSENFFTNAVQAVNPPMWSLVVEVHFYALLPLLAWVALRLGRGSRLGAGAVLAALGAASLAVWWVKVHQTAPAVDRRWGYSLPVTFFNFVPGMLLALVRSALAERPQLRLPPSDLMLVSGLALWIAAGGPGDRWAQPMLAVASMLVLGAVVLPAPAGPLTRALDARVLAVIGIASYSLYLWHFPVLDAIARHTEWTFVPLLVAGTAASVAVALASYALVERPFLRRRRRWGSTVPTAVDPAATRPPLRT